MRFHDLTSASFLSREERKAYLREMEKDAKRYGPDGRTPIGKRAVEGGRAVRMTKDGWRPL